MRFSQNIEQYRSNPGKTSTIIPISVDGTKYAPPWQPLSALPASNLLQVSVSGKMKIRISSFWIVILGATALAAFSAPSRSLDDAPKTSESLPSAQQVLAFLNQTIDWHHHLAVEEQLATDPADVLFLDENRQIANQVLRFSFDFARAEAQLLPNQPAQETTGSEPGKYQALIQGAAAADAEVRQIQSEIEGFKQKLRTSTGADRQKIQSTLDETQSELDLAQTRSQSLHNMLQFVSGAGASGSGGNLLAKIEELQHSVPELEAGAKTPGAQTNASGNTSSAVAQAANRRPQPSGILGLVEDLFALNHKAHVLDQTIQLTEALSRSAQQLRTPLVTNLSTYAEQGARLAKEADTSDPAQLEEQKHALDALTAKFKQASALVLPLGKQSVLFDLYKNNLVRWRNTVKSRYSDELRMLMVRLAVFGVILAIVFGLAEVWRRATFRYVHDLRRRYQFLLLRRIVLWCTIAMTVAFALATEIGSLATFAGLITAGIAVALQNVILAIAGYFFLIGKYGVRVGDRVQISGVTGDVVDIGLIRLHLMEITGKGPDRQPTGRVVVFSNSIVFQPTASFFKQIPGTNFIWHEVTLTLATDSDYHLAEERMLEAVERVYDRYKGNIERQHKQMEQTLSMAVPEPKPRSRVSFTQTGTEVIIRYPVDLEDAAEIDKQITQELADDLKQAPGLKLVGPGRPNIQSVIDDSRAA